MVDFHHFNQFSKSVQRITTFEFQNCLESQNQNLSVGSKKILPILEKLGIKLQNEINSKPLLNTANMIVKQHVNLKTWPLFAVTCQQTLSLLQFSSLKGNLSVLNLILAWKVSSLRTLGHQRLSDYSFTWYLQHNAQYCEKAQKIVHLIFVTLKRLV